MRNDKRQKHPKVELTGIERTALRHARIQRADFAEWEPAEMELATRGILPRSRCREIICSSRLQALGSVGPSIAEDLMSLGIESVEDLRGRKPCELYASLERLTGHKQDPCVEDVFRCAVAQAEDPGLPDTLRQWWMWTPCRGQSSSARPGDGGHVPVEPRRAQRQAIR